MRRHFQDESKVEAGTTQPEQTASIPGTGVAAEATPTAPGTTVDPTAPPASTPTP